MKKIKKWFLKNKNRIYCFLKKWTLFIINPHFIICFLIGWLFTNGWSYIIFALGTYFKINWMIILGTAYMSMLWAPFTPEKLVTLIIAIFLLKLLFPRDEKTLKVLHDELNMVKLSFKNKREKHKAGKIKNKEHN